MNFKPLACGFHSHSDMSLDGASTCSAKIIRAAELGRVADCVTDHGIMSGLVTHWEAAQKLFKGKKIDKPIRSIHGIEAYIIDPDREPKVYKNGKVEPRYLHLTIHFKTARAYQYFCKLTPLMEERAVVKYGERKPLLKLEELEPISGEITLGSGCLLGPVQQNFLRGRSDLAEKMYLRLKELAGPGNFFVEVFPHCIDKNWKKPERNKDGSILVPGEFVPITTIQRDENAIDPDPCTGQTIDIQAGPNAFVISLAQKYGDPVIISLDDHFACETDKEVQSVRLSNGREDWKFYNSYHSYSSEECARALQKQLGVEPKQIEQWIDNSYQFVDLFKDYKLETAKDRWLLPTTEMVYNTKDTSIDKLNALIDAHGRMPPKDDPSYQAYKDRADYEISVLSQNGTADFLPYFFVLEDAASYARANNIVYNTRGSAGGSLILYLLGVSITDPIKYDLPFERFLTLGRIKSGSLPDIDSDWQDRDVILGYLSAKYGNQMALIATDMMMRLKTSIMDVERATLGFVSRETAAMCHKIKGAQQGVSDSDWLFGYTDKNTGAHIEGFWEDKKNPVAEELRNWAKVHPGMWEVVQRCIGITKTRGVHAGGIVLTEGPVQNHMPLVHTAKGLATALNMKAVELVGGVKYDFLGVSTLMSLGVAMKSISEHTGKKIEWGEFPHDPAVYNEIILKDKLTAIFQLNTSTVRPYVKKIRPKTIKEIAALTALIRPGALDAPSPDPTDESTETAATYYVRCSQGLRKPYYIHPDLEPILGDTYGVIVMQEQALRLFRDLAGYTYETAEEVRRGIGKKDADLLAKHSAVLREKCVARGWTAEQAEMLFKSIMASSRYSFNMSHAVSYGIVAYNGCYLKHHYPVHFWRGELTVNSDDHDKIREHLTECKDYILDIDIVKSHPTEWLIEDNRLRPPLSVMKWCGRIATQNLKRLLSGEIGQIDENAKDTEEVPDAVE